MTMTIEEAIKLIALERKFRHAEVSGVSSKTPGKEERRERRAEENGKREEAERRQRAERAPAWCRLSAKSSQVKFLLPTQIKK